MFRKQGLTMTQEEYRVISIDKATEGIQTWGTFTNLEEALVQAQDVKRHDLDVYIHGDSNRVVSKV